MRKGLLMQTVALGTRSPLRHLGAGKEDRMQAARSYIRGSGRTSAPERKRVSGDRLVAWRQSRALLCPFESVAETFGKIPLGTC